MSENEYSYLTTPEFPEADAIIAKHLQRLALMRIQQFMSPNDKKEGWEYFGLNEDSDLDTLLRNAG